MKCAQNRKCTSSMCEQSLYKLEYKGIKPLELHITPTKHPKSVLDGQRGVDPLLDLNRQGDAGD